MRYITKKPIICPVTEAQAAPETPMPHVKINTGSSTQFTTAPTTTPYIE